jgi:hypothetical protein
VVASKWRTLVIHIEFRETKDCQVLLNSIIQIGKENTVHNAKEFTGTKLCR